MDGDAPARAGAGSAAAHPERDAEIRELLEARNARRARRGEPPLDVDEELARLTAPMIDPELRGEIRDLVIARNKRRERLASRRWTSRPRSSARSRGSPTCSGRFTCARCC